MSSSTTDRSETSVAQEEAPTVDVTMPDTGSDEGVTLLGWLVEPGQPVEVDEPICLVSWNGTTAEVGSPATGVLRMLSIAAGVTVPMGTSLALIDTQLAPRAPEPEPDPDPEPDRDPEPEPQPAEVEAEPAVVETRPPEPEAQPELVPEGLVRDAPADARVHADLGAFVSPAVRRLAAELEIDVEEIQGTGGGGRVTLRDVRAYASLAGNSLPRA